ncbi:hypothetical protein HDF16_002542 [Granulicella aggregans]|jgi:hypothetical protein|uniref:DinB-like domain-containing protein n=1 Tax=Granulicella aggregans TaxID=474949 RepID=A0A7W7ZEF1_9BACT|nr:DinB family protein [Granulicella aggregans]MBB5057836.1 hypothetical protein [Granulicella aggregans]
MKDELELLREELELALGGLDSSQTQLRPAATPDKWSIQQIVGHLLRTYAATEKAMEARILKGLPTKAKVTPMQWAAQCLVLGVGYFPSGRIAPEIVCAPLGEEAAPAGILINQLGLALSAMNRKLAAAEALFGSRHRAVNHMALGPLNFAQWSKFHLTHGRHHIKQIVAIRRQHGV